MHEYLIIRKDGHSFTNDLPVKDTRKGDRHKPGYWAGYLRDRRAKKKSQEAKP